MWYRKVLKIPTRRNSSWSSNKRTLLLLRRRINVTKERASVILVVSRDTTPKNARRACIGPRNLQT
jgi:hypothetical protein